MPKSQRLSALLQNNAATVRKEHLGQIGPWPSLAFNGPSQASGLRPLLTRLRHIFLRVG